MVRAVVMTGLVGVSASAWAGDADEAASEQASRSEEVAPPVEIAPVAIEEGEAASGDLRADVDDALAGRGQNLQGGRLTDATVVTLASGFPRLAALGVRVRAGDLELGPSVYVDHSQAWSVLSPDFGAGADLAFRVRVWGRGALDLSVRLNVGVDGRWGGLPRLAVDLGDPGVRGSIHVNGVVDIDLGIDVLPQLLLVPGRTGVGFRMAFPAVFGVEGDVLPGVQVGFIGRVGPSWVLVAGPGGNPSGARPYAEGLLYVGVGLANLRR